MYYDTKHITIKGTNYCVYCGDVCQENFDIDYRDQYDYYYCICEKAQKENEIEDAISALKQSLPKENYTLVRKLRYEKELESLKLKYSIEE